MQYKTFSELKAIIERELDLETEDFIQPEEFKQYVNDGVDTAEATIHKLGLQDEYFLTFAMKDLTVGQTDVTLPDNIYLNKIKRIIYINGTTIYEVFRLKGQYRFEELERMNQYTSISDYYQYLMRNDSAAAGRVIQITPPSRETVSNVLKIWYYRDANHWEDDDDALCDIPDIGTNFVKQYVRYRCYDKEGHPNQQEAKDRMEAAMKLMVETFEDMVPDEDSTIVPDKMIYEDFS